MRLYGKVTFLGFDKKSFDRDVREAAYKTLLLAASYFLEAAAPEIPVDTGMARGSFLNLAQFLRGKGVNVNVNIPKTAQRLLRSARKDGTRKIYYYHTTGERMWKEPKTGQELSTKPGQIIKRTNNVLKFQYESRVKHLNLNESKWETFERGSSAFQNFLYFQQINPIDYVVNTSFTLGKEAPSDMTRFNIRKQKTVRNI